MKRFVDPMMVKITPSNYENLTIMNSLFSILFGHYLLNFPTMNSRLLSVHRSSKHNIVASFLKNYSFTPLQHA